MGPVGITESSTWRLVVQELLNTPDYLPLEARLNRAPQPLLERLLLPEELALIQRLDRSKLPVPLIDLRTEWGDGWEQRAQVVFDLIADGIILWSMPPAADDVPSRHRPAICCRA